MTFEDDFIQIYLPTINKTNRILLSRLKLEWPPPKIITIRETKFIRVRYSSITDEQRSKMTHVCRGAEYEVLRESANDEHYE